MRGSRLLQAICLSIGIRENFQPLFCADRPSDMIAALRHLPFPWIDANKRTPERFAKIPDCRYGLAGTDFQDNRSGNGLEPLPEGQHLLTGSLSDPFPVSKHQDIRSGRTTAIGAGRRGREKTTGGLIDARRQVVGLPDFGTAGVQTLQKMNRSMTFDDTVVRKTRLLELSVHIACENEKTSRKLFSKMQKVLKPLVGIGPPIEVQTVSIKSPGLSDVGSKGPGIRHFFKGQPGFSQRRVSPPESMGSTKIRKS